MTTTTAAWRFEIICPQAQRVYLVAESVDGRTQTIAMARSPSGKWVTHQDLSPDNYQFHYFASDGVSLTHRKTRGLRVLRPRSA
jgi:hypothetical protein